MKIAIYARVSTGKQELANQLTPLKEYAARRGFEVVKIYQDVATGSRSDREQYTAMIRDAHQKKFDAILVWALDRLGREGMVKTVVLIEELAQIGVGILSYTETYLDTTNELVRNILLAVLSSLAKVERQKISERTKAGLARVKARGIRLGRPPIPMDTKKRIVELMATGIGCPATAQQVGVTAQTVRNFLRSCEAIANA